MARSRIQYISLAMLVLLSIGTSIAITLAPNAIQFLYTKGIYIITSVLCGLLLMLALLWIIFNGKKDRVAPHNHLILQSRLFFIWFAAQGLYWGTGFSLITSLCLSLFGPLYWVTLIGNATTGILVFIIMGIIIGFHRITLGICWQGPDFNLKLSWWEWVGGVAILNERHHMAVTQDQQRPEPLMWGLSRIQEWSTQGGAHRSMDLMRGRQTTTRKEWIRKGSLLVPLLGVTILMVIIVPWLLGITPGYEKLPEGWLTQNLNLKPDAPQKKKDKQKEKAADQHKKETPPDKKPDQKKSQKESTSKPGKSKKSATPDKQPDSQNQNQSKTGDKPGNQKKPKDESTPEKKQESPPSKTPKQKGKSQKQAKKQGKKQKKKQPSQCAQCQQGNPCGKCP